MLFPIIIIYQNSLFTPILKILILQAGFGDNAENQRKSGKSFWGFANALAPELYDPYARWYPDEISDGKKETVSESANFAFYRLMTKNGGGVKPRSPKDLPQSLLFRDAGFALMHNDVTNTASDIMLNFTALPFGFTGHGHAAHNGFGINVGGKQMFRGSGHYSNFTDKHTLMHYRTRGHNTILADGIAQVIGENGFGWIARFKDTPKLTYVMGDATHAYGEMSTPFWIDRMKQFEVDYTKENRFGDPGITRFRLHFVFLRPDIVIIYDKLQAQTPVEWTWLLHSYNKMEKGEKGNVVFGRNKVANSRVDIFNLQPLKNYITNEFYSPVINWKQRGNSDKPYEYTKHWHLELSTKTKSAETRFLSIIQIDQEKWEQTSFRSSRNKNGKLEDWRLDNSDRNGRRKETFTDNKNSKGDGIEYINQGKTIIK